MHTLPHVFGSVACLAARALPCRCRSAHAREEYAEPGDSSVEERQSALLALPAGAAEPMGSRWEARRGGGGGGLTLTRAWA